MLVYAVEIGDTTITLRTNSHGGFVVVSSHDDRHQTTTKTREIARIGSMRTAYKAGDNAYRNACQDALDVAHTDGTFDRNAEYDVRNPA